MANPLKDFLRAAAEAAREVTDGALGDVRNRWEEAWFGRELTPEPAGTSDPLRRFTDAKNELVQTLDELRGDVCQMDFYGQRAEVAFEKLLDELKRGQLGKQPDREHELDVER